MITEDYVSFETAKLLKEKGFEGENRDWYNMEGFIEEIGVDDGIDPTAHEDIFNNVIPAPTLQMVMKWLREKCIFITLNIISFNLNDLPVWSFDIWHNNNHEYRSSDYFDSYEQTCEAAIKYCLENLI